MSTAYKTGDRLRTPTDVKVRPPGLPDTVIEPHHVLTVRDVREIRSGPQVLIDLADVGAAGQLWMYVEYFLPARPEPTPSER